MRDRSIDVARGVLTLIMVYCHVLQFFADAQLFPVVNRYIDVINLTVFPAFVFCFGATAVLAYLKKPYAQALPGMLRTTLRALAAFYLSGIGFRVLREGKPLAVGTVRRVLQLTDIPGWSEFLVSFALYGLLLIAAFAGLRWLMTRPLAMLAAGCVCLAGCFIPYGAVGSVHAALFVGGTQFSFFPILQYMPFFLAGMAYAAGAKRQRWVLVGIALALGAAGLVKAVIIGGLPARFSPDWAWIALSALPVCIVMLAAKALTMGEGSVVRKALDPVCAVLSHFGSRSLYYLLMSNLVIFTLVGKGIVPTMSRKSVLPWTAVIQSPQGAAVWTGVLLAVLWFVSVLAGRSAPKRSEREK